MRKQVFNLLLALLVILAVLPLTCLAQPQRKLLVVATIPPLAAIAKCVAGDRAEVRYLVPPLSDPHQFSMSPQDADLVQKADLVITVGKEAFLKSVLRVARGEVIGWEDWVSAGVYVKNGNPHYLWLYPPNAVKVARVVYERLAALDPAGASYYKRNYEEFAKRVSELADWIESYVEVSGVKGVPVALAGAHFEPLVEFMKLSVVGVLIRGEGKTPTPQEITDFAKVVKEKGAKVIIVLATQKAGDEGRLAREVSRATGVPIVYLYGVMFSSTDTYIEYIKYTVTSIVAGIQASSTKSKAFNSGISYEVFLISVITLAAVILIETVTVMKR